MRPTVVTSGETVSASASCLYLDHSQTGTITFLNAYQDQIFATGAGDRISMVGTQFSTLYDQAQGLNLELHGYCTTLTIKDFQLDQTGHLDLYDTGFTSNADAMAHLVADGNGGSYLTPVVHGKPIADFVGDPSVMAAQITVHS